MPKGQESGMPEVEVWQGFFDPTYILDCLDCERPSNVVEVGCGYVLFAVAAAKRSGGTAYVQNIDPLKGRGRRVPLHPRETGVTTWHWGY